MIGARYRPARRAVGPPPPPPTQPGRPVFWTNGISVLAAWDAPAAGEPPTYTVLFEYAFSSHPSSWTFYGQAGPAPPHGFGPIVSPAGPRAHASSAGDNSLPWWRVTVTGAGVPAQSVLHI